MKIIAGVEDAGRAVGQGKNRFPGVCEPGPAGFQSQDGRQDRADCRRS